MLQLGRGSRFRRWNSKTSRNHWRRSHEFWRRLILGKKMKNLVQFSIRDALTTVLPTPNIPVRIERVCTVQELVFHRAPVSQRWIVTQVISNIKIHKSIRSIANAKRTLILDVKKKCRAWCYIWNLLSHLTTYAPRVHLDVMQDYAAKCVHSVYDECV